MPGNLPASRIKGHVEALVVADNHNHSLTNSYDRETIAKLFGSPMVTLMTGEAALQRLAQGLQPPRGSRSAAD